MGKPFSRKQKENIIELDFSKIFPRDGIRIPRCTFATLLNKKRTLMLHKTRYFSAILRGTNNGTFYLMLHPQKSIWSSNLCKMCTRTIISLNYQFNLIFLTFFSDYYFSTARCWKKTVP